MGIPIGDSHDDQTSNCRHLVELISALAEQNGETRSCRPLDLKNLTEGNRIPGTYQVLDQKTKRREQLGGFDVLAFRLGQMSRFHHGQQRPLVLQGRFDEIVGFGFTWGDTVRFGSPKVGATGPAESSA